LADQLRSLDRPEQLLRGLHDPLPGDEGSRRERRRGGCRVGRVVRAAGRSAALQSSMSAFNRVPLATYRLQLNAEFPFEAALAQLDYLQRLGITYLYLSPVMAAREGSGHGYDVTDPTEINHELGGAAGFERLSRAARERGMGVLLDIVPNHMAADSANRWWMAAL